MRMYFKLAIKDMKRIGWMNILCILFLSATITSVISIVSAVEIKMKDYRLLKPYIKQNGVLLLPIHLAEEAKDGGTILRDEEELRDYLDGVKDIVCYEKIWEPKIAGISRDAEAYCYSKNAIRCMNPKMKEGRWFSKEDTKADELSVVLTGNAGEKIHVGDTLVLRTDMDPHLKMEATVIGIIDDREKLFFNDIYKRSYGDLRDCYYVFDNESEERVKIFFSDEQILSGVKDEKYGYLNFRVSPTEGFQKQVTGITIITFRDGITDDEMKKNMQKLYELSFIPHEYNLEDFKKNSIRYLTEELKAWIPLFVCVFVFILITVIGVNTIMVKKQLGNYAVYHICGMPWRSCAKIAFTVTLLDGLLAESLVLIALFAFKVTRIFQNSAIHMGAFQMIAANALLLLIVFLSNLIPGYLVHKSSAKEIFAENKETF